MRTIINPSPILRARLLPPAPRLRRALLVLLSAVIVVTSYLGSEAIAQDRSQGRSMVISRNGIVAAESPLAAQAGVQILERGGNAVDAGIAANAMMGGVEPMMNGIGGGVFVDFFVVEVRKSICNKR